MGRFFNLRTKRRPGSPAKPLDRETTAWRWLFLASLPLSVLVRFLPAGDWGSMDEGEWAYDHGTFLSWAESLKLAFLPSSQKVFLFGLYRPFSYGLLFKVFGSLDIGAAGFRALCWVGSWLGALGLAWGLSALLGAWTRAPRLVTWLGACLVFWSPAWQLTTHLVYPDCWLQPGLTGVFWALIYAQPGALPRLLERSGALRAGLASFAAIASLQSHEAGVLMLAWSSLPLLLQEATRAKGPRRWLAPSLPLLVAVAYVLLYRGVDPGTANRTEIVVSTRPGDLLGIARYYLLFGTNSFQEAIVATMGLKPPMAGVTADRSWLPAFLFWLALGLAVFQKPAEARKKKERGVPAWAWLLLGAVGLAAPFFAMQNRALYYYALRLQAMISAAFAFRVASARPGFRAVTVSAYVLSMFLAGETVFREMNWARQWGAVSKRFYSRVMADPGASSCTSEAPCCLEVTQRGWIYNEWTVNWNDGAPFPPRFVRPAAAAGSCAKTIRYAGPYDW